VSVPDTARQPVIVGAARTPVGKFLGSFLPLKAPDLGAVAIREALRRAGVRGDDVQEVIMGHVVQAGVGQAPARQAALKAGVPPGVSALTVNMVCGSGLRAVMLAAQAVRAGDARVVVAGGQESMSNAPYLNFGMRSGTKFGEQRVADAVQLDGLWCATCDVAMGGHAEYTARKAGITREQQDRFAAESQRRAHAAITGGKFKDEIVPVQIAGRKGPTTVDTDEGVRGDTTLESLAKLKPAFAPPGKASAEELADGYTVTAGNASTLNDGAAAVVVTSEEYALANGLPILARITEYATGPVAPQDLFFAPIQAVQNLMRKEGTAIGDYDLIEANEAFASQALATGQGLDWDWDRVNVNGGAIAIGHPIGASGARVLTTLLYAMQDRGAHRGLATLCLGGGDAVALSVERVA
jgi:acetyl-CoA C-acetyltransferase